MQTELIPASAAPAIDLPFEIVSPELGLSIDEKASLEAAFTGYATDAMTLVAKASDITDPKEARKLRLEIKALRVAAEKTRKGLKDGLLVKGRAIDDANKALVAYIDPAEKALDDIEKAEERAEAARLEALRTDRLDALFEFDHNTHGLDLSTLSEEDWAIYYEDAKAIYEARKAREAKAEEERIAKERADQEERERLAAENARLKAEAEEREAQAKIEREAAEKLRAEAEAKAKAEREKAEADRKAAEEKARVEREAIEVKAKAEREELEAKAAEEKRIADAAAAKEKAAREKAEAEAKALKDAEAKRIADAEAAEKKRIADEAAAAKKAAAAPDKEKLQAFAHLVRSLEVPEVKSEEANAVRAEIVAKVANFANWIGTQIGEL